LPIRYFELRFDYFSEYHFQLQYLFSLKGRAELSAALADITLIITPASEFRLSLASFNRDDISLEASSRYFIEIFLHYENRLYESFSLIV
jgi:hypothetical protein